MRHTLPLMAVLLAASTASPTVGDERSAPALQAQMKVGLADGQGIPAKGGKVFLELTFTNTSGKEQQLANAEYRISVLNADGEQVNGGLVFTTELRDITLKDRTTTDKPGLSVEEGKLQAGKEYYLIVSVRNLVGLVKFTAK